MSGVAAIIPLYNHERYVAEAVQSLLAQTWPVRRIILVDDGSTDHSLEMVKRIRDERLTILTQPNSGAHVALNRGIAAATECDYVAILNSDDVFHPSRVEECQQFLDEHRERDVVATRLRLIDEKGEPVPKDQPRAKWFAAAWSVESDDLVAWLGVANFIGTTSNIFARRAHLLANPFRAYRYVHDYFFCLQAALSGKLALLPRVRLDYRYHAANTINAGAPPLVREVLQMNLDLLRELAPRLEAAPPLRAAWARYHRAAWSNISSFRADLFLYLLSEFAAGRTVTVDSLQEEPFAELTEFPNRALVNLHGGSGAMAQDAALGEAYQKLKSERAAMIDLLQAQERLLRSRWVGLGTALGIFRASLAGQNAPEKLAYFRQRLGQSTWLRLGRILRSRSAHILKNGK